LIAVCILLFAAITTRETSVSNSKETLSKQQPTAPSMQTPKPKEPIRKEYLGSAPNVDLLAADATGLDEVDVDNYRQWLRSRGYFGSEELGPYTDYDELTLLNLGQQGDLKALEILAWTYYAEGENDKTRVVLHQALIHGSTAALSFLSHILLSDYQSEKDPVAQEELAIQALAHLHAGVLLGDIFLEKLELAEFQKHTGYSPSPEAQQKIQQAAREIQSEILAEREKLGLIRDITPPESITLTHQTLLDNNASRTTQNVKPPSPQE
jgi:hypothetical protein